MGLVEELLSDCWGVVKSDPWTFALAASVWMMGVSAGFVMGAWLA